MNPKRRLLQAQTRLFSGVAHIASVVNDTRAVDGRYTREVWKLVSVVERATDRLHEALMEARR